MDKEIINQFKTTKTIDELKEVAAKNGYTLNDEEANRYFDLFHAEGKIADDELNNVTGGLCSLTRNGKFYSEKGKHYLIASFGTCCDYFTGGPHSSSCSDCDHSFKEGNLTYCKVRTWENDPLNPA